MVTRAAFHARIQNVVDMQVGREQVDDFQQRRVVQIQSAGHRHRRQRLRGCVCAGAVCVRWRRLPEGA